MTISERILWQNLRSRGIGFKFRRQVPVDKYVLDFFCVEAMVCVEVDGPQHEFTQNDDRARDEFLRSAGIETLRIRSLHLFEPKDVLTQIRSACERRIQH